VLTQMQYLGHCLTPWWINSEIGDLKSEKPPDGKLFRFLRYDVKLEWAWIQELRTKVGAEAFDKKIGRQLTETDLVRMRSMDDPTIIEDIYNLACIAAKDQVDPDHWKSEIPTWCEGRRPCAEPRTMPAREKPVGRISLWWFACSKRISTAFSYLRSKLVLMFNPPPK
jgi:hypothetical protein